MARTRLPQEQGEMLRYLVLVLSCWAFVAWEYLWGRGRTRRDCKSLQVVHVLHGNGRLLELLEQFCSRLRWFKTALK